ncbi:12570_t:CDS:10 [Ambispora gerdemannii]|uniref:12570_t:CDS:1 n=1 Tax=Ambispora gerdemannii TaxID=144530 RepID=A0A9N9BVH3_9GLOM|nr:12570_t:CDS:10 [Ambispora gerdemannii]
MKRFKVLEVRKTTSQVERLTLDTDDDASFVTWLKVLTSNDLISREHLTPRHGSVLHIRLPDRSVLHISGINVQKNASSNRLTPKTRSALHIRRVVTMVKGVNRQGKDALIAWWEIPKVYQEKLWTSFYSLLTESPTKETGEQRTHKVNLENNETTKEGYKLKLGGKIAQGIYLQLAKIGELFPVDSRRTRGIHARRSRLRIHGPTSYYKGNLLDTTSMLTLHAQTFNNNNSEQRKCRTYKNNSGDTVVSEHVVKIIESLTQLRVKARVTTYIPAGKGLILPDFVNASNIEFTSATAATGASGSFNANNNEDNEHKRLRLNMKGWAAEDEKLVTLVNRLAVVL